MLRMHGMLPSSRVNGPGVRAVVHLQGCTLGCPACFNPDTHPHAGGTLRSAADLADELASLPIDGVTVSGGEPFQQAGGLLALVVALRERGVDSLMIFSGYDLGELHEKEHGPEILQHVDLLVCGRYDPTRATRDVLLSSANQRLHYLTARHTPAELGEPGADVEISIHPDGTVTMTGFPSPALRRAIRDSGSGE